MATPRRRRAKVETAEAPAQMNETLQETNMVSETPRKKRVARRALWPVKEAYFVGIGAIDWALEKAMTIEKTLSERGQRRSEAMGRLASTMGAGVTSKTREMSNRGRARVRRIGEKISESMQEEETQQQREAPQPQGEMPQPQPA